MQVSFLYQNIFDTSFTHHRLPPLDNRHQTKKEYKKVKYIPIYLSLRTLIIHLIILSFTLNPRAMEIPRHKHSIMFRYLKKTNPNILNIADIWIRCKDFLPIKKLRQSLTMFDIYAILVQLPPPIQVEEGGESIMFDMIVSFTFSVLASVVAYYVCKWLDEEN